MGMTIVNIYFDRENTQNHCDHLRDQHGHKMVPSGYLTIAMERWPICQLMFPLKPPFIYIYLIRDLPWLC